MNKLRHWLIVTILLYSLIKCINLIFVQIAKTVGFNKTFQSKSKCLNITVIDVESPMHNSNSAKKLKSNNKIKLQRKKLAASKISRSYLKETEASKNRRSNSRGDEWSLDEKLST